MNYKLCFLYFILSVFLDLLPDEIFIRQFFLYAKLKYPSVFNQSPLIFHRQKIGIGVEKGFICLNLKRRGTLSTFLRVYNKKPFPH